MLSHWAAAADEVIASPGLSFPFGPLQAPPFSSFTTGYGTDLSSVEPTFRPGFPRAFFPLSHGPTCCHHDPGPARFFLSAGFLNQRSTDRYRGWRRPDGVYELCIGFLFLLCPSSVLPFFARRSQASLFVPLRTFFFFFFFLFRTEHFAHSFFLLLVRLGRLATLRHVFIDARFFPLLVPCRPSFRDACHISYW